MYEQSSKRKALGRLERGGDGRAQGTGDRVKDNVLTFGHFWTQTMSLAHTTGRNAIAGWRCTAYNSACTAVARAGLRDAIHS